MIGIVQTTKVNIITKKWNNNLSIFSLNVRLGSNKANDNVIRKSGAFVYLFAKAIPETTDIINKVEFDFDLLNIENAKSHTEVRKNDKVSGPI